jgi:diamine N-acetyltransferase
MITIKKATIEDIPVIVELAAQTWFVTYKDIISKEQIDYMFGEMYTPESLHKQMTFLHHTFLLMYENDYPLGYASYAKIPDRLGVNKLHKLYVLPNTQGKGLGKLLLKEVEKLTLEEGNKVLWLNVNRHNKAKDFYEKLGYTSIELQDIPFGKFWLNDYLMEKKLE